MSKSWHEIAWCVVIWCRICDKRVSNFLKSQRGLVAPLTRTAVTSGMHKEAGMQKSI